MIGFQKTNDWFDEKQTLSNYNLICILTRKNVIYE